MSDTSDAIGGGILGCIGVLLLLALVGVIAFAWTYLLTILTTLVFDGFHCPLPFWPVFGAIFLIQLLLGALSRRG